MTNTDNFTNLYSTSNSQEQTVLLDTSNDHPNQSARAESNKNNDYHSMIQNQKSVEIQNSFQQQASSKISNNLLSTCCCNTTESMTVPQKTVTEDMTTKESLKDDIHDTEHDPNLKSKHECSSLQSTSKSIQDNVDDDNSTTAFATSTMTAKAIDSTSPIHDKDLGIPSRSNVLKTNGLQESHQEIEKNVESESKANQKRSVFDKSPIASSSTRSARKNQANPILGTPPPPPPSPLHPQRKKGDEACISPTTTMKSSLKRRLGSPMKNVSSPRKKQLRMNGEQSLPLSSSMTPSTKSSLPPWSVMKSSTCLKTYASSPSSSASSNSSSPSPRSPNIRKKKYLQSIVHNIMKNYIPCPTKSHWTTTCQANNPCEDRYASLSNVFMTPSSSTTTTATTTLEAPQTTLPPLVRMSLFTVLDGHGGFTISEHASKILLPLLARNICEKLECNFVHSGQFNVNGEGHGEHNQIKTKKRSSKKNKDLHYSYVGLYSDDDDNDDNDNDGENDYDDEYDDEELDKKRVTTNDSDDRIFDSPRYSLDENCYLIHGRGCNDVDNDHEDTDDKHEPHAEPWYKAPDCIEAEGDETCLLNNDHTHQSEDCTRNNDIDHSTTTAAHTTRTETTTATATTNTSSKTSQSFPTMSIIKISKISLR